MGYMISTFHRKFTFPISNPYKLIFANYNLAESLEWYPPQMEEKWHEELLLNHIKKIKNKNKI